MMVVDKIPKERLVFLVSVFAAITSGLWFSLRVSTSHIQTIQDDPWTRAATRKYNHNASSEPFLRNKHEDRQPQLLQVTSNTTSATNKSPIEQGSSSTPPVSLSSTTSSPWKVLLKPLIRFPNQITFVDFAGASFSNLTIHRKNATMRALEYRQEFDSIHQHAFDVTNRSFCLDWSIESDAWWTHHPEWSVSVETDTHYCFHYSTSNPNKTAFLTRVYQNQFTSQNCSNQVSVQMWSSGWHADVNNIVKKLYIALFAKRPLQVMDRSWHYAAPDAAGKGNKIPSPPACPTMDMECYFLPMSPCPHLPESNDHLLKARDYYPELPSKVRFYHPHYNWLREYLTRPKRFLRKRVYDFVQNQTLSRPCTAFHVRRSDVILHQSQSRKYRALSDYLNAKKVNATFQLKNNILLLTDDQNAISEAQALHPKYHWMYLKRPRWKATDGGWERQLPSSNPIFEMTVLLATFQLVQQCDSLVRTHSGFGDWLQLYMKQKNATAHVVNLDQGNKRILSTFNTHTKYISKEYNVSGAAMN